MQQHALMAGTPYRVAAKTRGYMTVASVAGGRLSVGDRIIAGNAVFVVDQAVRIAAGWIRAGACHGRAGRRSRECSSR